MRQINNNIFLSSRKAILLSGLFLIVLFFAFPLNRIISSENDNKEISAEEVEENQKKMDQIKEKIRQVQSEVDKQVLEIKAKQKETRTLKSEVSIYKDRIYKNELEVKETKLITEETEFEIEETENKIDESGIRIEKDRALLKDFVQLLYSYEQDSVFEILVTKKSFSAFFNEVDAVESVKDEIFGTIINLKNERENAELQKEELEKQNEEHYQLIQMRVEQNSSLDDLKEQKKELLKITKGEEKQFQQIMEENKNILPTLRAQLHDLQSLGQKIEFTDAISVAKYVSSLTGVRPEFLLGILKKESSLGTNVGGGIYTIDMRPSNRATFEAITAELGYDPNAMPVSRKPSKYPGWGGAMGPAQMMPKTWMAYKARVSEVTGNYPPDPWDLTDAIASMAIKLSGIPGVTQGDYNAEYKAAGMYFAGSNWRKFLFYPDEVMLFTNMYAEELK